MITNLVKELNFDSLTVWILKCLQDNYVYILHTRSSLINGLSEDPRRSRLQPPSQESQGEATNDDQETSTIVIDPTEAIPVRDFLKYQNLNLDEIWITHHHGDHIGGVEKLRSFFNCQVRGFNLMPERLPQLNIPLSESDTWNLSDFTVSILHLPGHTKDHIAYWIQNSQHSLLFSGDVLFGFGCGRVFEGTLEQMFTTLKRVAQLPDQTLIFCSHEYTEKNLEFTLQQKISNPIFRDIIEKRKGTVLKLRAENEPTVPLSLKEEKETNLFLLALNDTKPLDAFKKLREARNHF